MTDEKVIDDLLEHALEFDEDKEVIIKKGLEKIVHRKELKNRKR